jgi:signal transduction histidine kinase
MLHERDPERLRLTLSSILESTTDGIFVIDRDERVVIFNHACERLTGLAREAVVGGRLRCDEVFRCHRFAERGGVVGSEDLPRVTGFPSGAGAGNAPVPLPVVAAERGCAVLDIFGAQKPGAREETMLISRTGERHWVETVFSPVQAEDGEAVFTVGVLRVIDDRKSAEAEVQEKNRELEGALAELRERTRQLVRSEKMASIGQLAAGVAHELNTPLNTILGYSQLIREQLGGVPLDRVDDTRARLAELADELQAVEGATKRCRSIVQSLLSFSRPAEGVRLERDLVRVVERVLGFLKHDLDRRAIRLELDHDAEAPVLADRSQLEQVLMKLVKNAIDAMPEGGAIRVSIDAGGDEVHLRLADSGVGIPEHMTTRIFEPFFTTKPVGSGTGLGLPITARIIEEHGGRMEVEGREGRGAVFHVWLPRAGGGPQSRMSASRPPAGGAAGP